MRRSDLATLGDAVEPPDRLPSREGAGRPHGRLEQLQAWWRTVGSAPDRRPPAAVAHRWLARPVAAAPPVRAEVDIGRFAPPADADRALDWGVAVADDAVDDGADLILLSVPDGDGRATPLAAHMLGLDPVEAMGWPGRAGLDDDAWTASVAALRDDSRVLRTGAHSPDGMLDRLPSAALAAGSGLLVRAAARRTPVLLDGAAAATCALLVHRVTRHARGWWQAAHTSGSVLHDRLLAELRLQPLLGLGIGAEDGTGVRLGLAVLEAATADFDP